MKEYDQNKRSRSYNVSWSDNRKWLKDTDKGMVCEWCTNYGDDLTSVFVTGCQSYKLDSVIKHSSSKLHEKSSLIFQAQNKPKNMSEASKIKTQLNAHIIGKLEKMFRNVHALVIKNRPLSDFNWMCNLDDLKGLDLGQTYRNNECAKIFMDAIVNVEFKKVNNQINKSKFVCFIGDGSTDSAIKEQEMWFARTSVGGNISVRFIGIHSEEKANAQNIVGGLKSTVESNLNIDWPSLSCKLAALACDGASVMTGSVGGVSALLRREQPSLLTVHCMAHRLELVLKDACKKIKLYDKTVNVLLMGLYYFYHNSALNRAMLSRSFMALKDKPKTELLVPTRVGGTRWVGHTLRALNNLSNSYEYVVQHLGQLTEPSERVSSDSKAKAQAFLKLLKCKDVVCMLFFLMDLLGPLRRLSLLLQDRTCVIGNQHAELGAVLEVIRKFKTSDGPHLRKVIDVTEFAGTQLTHCNMASFQVAQTQLLDQVQAALQKRFAEFSYPNVVLSTRIAHIQTWPKSWEQLKDYGDADLKVLLDHFDNIITHGEVDSAEAEVEWTLLKKNMYDDYIAKQLNPDWKDVNDRYGDSLKNILIIIDLILTMSPSSAEAERGFSQMKLIKTSIRSRLSQKSLNQCLAIRLLSEDISNFDPTPAINYWNESGSRSRRPEFKRQASSLTERNLTDDADKVIVPETFDNTSEVENEASFELWHSHSYYEKDFGEESDFDDGEDEASVFAQLMEDYRSS